MSVPTAIRLVGGEGFLEDRALRGIHALGHGAEPLGPQLRVDKKRPAKAGQF